MDGWVLRHAGPVVVRLVLDADPLRLLAQHPTVAWSAWGSDLTPRRCGNNGGSVVGRERCGSHRRSVADIRHSERGVIGRQSATHMSCVEFLSLDLEEISGRDIHVDKARRSRYYSYTISVRFTVISTHKTSGAHLDTSHNYSGNRGELARHEFRPATISVTMRQSRTLIATSENR